MKILIKKCYMRNLLDNLKIDLRKRKNIVYLQSLCFHQISSPSFNQMLKYSYNDYFNDDKSDYLNVNQVCFKDLPLN
jgi:hypothetical protein